MKISGIYSNISISDFCSDFKEKCFQNKKSLSSEDKKFVRLKVQKFKVQPIEDTIKAVALLALWEPDAAIKEARKKGAFRYRAHGFKGNRVLNMLDFFISRQNLFEFNTKTLNYLLMKRNLSWLYDSYMKTEKKIVQEIKEHHSNRLKIKRGNIIVETALFKELLVYIDYIFYKNINVYREPNDKNKIKCYGNEEIANAISYLIFLYNKNIGIRDAGHYFVDTDYILSDEIEQLILLACKIVQIEEWELAIDYLDYDVKINGNVTTISGPQNFLEQSIQLGHIRRNMQELVLRNHLEDKFCKAMSISHAMDYSIDKLGDTITAEISDGKLSRYRFEIPFPLLECFKREGLYKEELISSIHLAKELILGHEVLLEKKITKKCSMREIILFQRVFVIMHYFAYKILYNKKDKKKILASLATHFSRDIFKKLLHSFIPDEEKIDELLDVFTYNGFDYKLDLQYTPFLLVSKGLLFSNTIVARSNLTRNVIAHSYQIKNQIVNNDEGLEPLVALCNKIFSKRGYQTISNKKYKYNQKEGEIDVIVSNEYDIILIECKSPLAPTSPFEMRSSYDHIEKASAQLDQITEAMNDFSFRKAILKQWGIEDNNQNIKTCIVFGNRLFSGFKYSIHPIRYIYELDTILNEGIIRSDAGSWKIWMNEQYTHEDLINFLDEDKSFIRLPFKALEPVDMNIKVQGKKIIFKTYALNQLKLLEMYDGNLQIIDKNYDWTYKKNNMEE